MQDRKPEDRLRQEYFDLLPDIRRVLWYLEAEIRYHTREVVQGLRRHEQLLVKSRVKECESAVKTLRDQQEGRTFDPDRLDSYSLSSLPDLAGVRVLVFPNSRLVEVDKALRSHFPMWTSKPVTNDSEEALAPKYYGHCENVSDKVSGEYQIVPMLLGLFWEVEHSAMYKFREVANSKDMQKQRANVEDALSNFEKEIDRFVRDYTEPPAGTA